MELKYCERCGVLLGYVSKKRKYCLECSFESEREHSSALYKKKKAGKQDKIKEIPCAWCGKPLLPRNCCQKYHLQCRKDAYAARQRELREAYRANGKPRKKYETLPKNKKKKEPHVPTIQEIEAKAKELGTTYGKVVLGIQLGKIHME